METKQTAESTKTDAQFKIDYNSEEYYKTVANKLNEISDTLSAMLGCSKDAISEPLKSIVVSVVRSKRAALEKQICKLDSFIRDIIETGSEKESMKQDTKILKGTKTNEDRLKEFEEFCIKNREKIRNP